MTKVEIYNSIDAITPRKELLVSILEHSDKRAKLRLRKCVPVIAAALVIVFAIVYFTSAGNRNDNTTPIVPSQINNNNIFIMTVSAKDGEKHRVNEANVKVAEVKLKPVKNEDGTYACELNKEALFSVSGDEIEAVTFECLNGSFPIIDEEYREYLIAENEYYDLSVPMTEEFLYLTENETIALLLEKANAGDYDSLLNGKTLKNANDYRLDVIRNFNKNKGDEEVSLNLLDKEKFYRIVPQEKDGKPVKSYTFRNYLEKEKYEFVCNWWIETDEAKTKKELINNYSGVSDILTVTVEYKDKSTQTIKYNLSFDDDGCLNTNLA